MVEPRQETQTVPPREQWLLRTVQNLIVGPFSKSEIKALILDGRLDSNDEVCMANEYWFSIYETAEVKKYLDIDVKTVFENADASQERDDTTETQIGAAQKASDNSKVNVAATKAAKSTEPVIDSVNTQQAQVRDNVKTSRKSSNTVNLGVAHTNITETEEEVTEPISNEIIRRNPALQSALLNRDPVMQEILSKAPRRAGSFAGFMFVSVPIIMAMVYIFIKLKHK